MVLYHQIEPAYRAYVAAFGEDLRPWSMSEFAEWIQYSSHYYAFAIITSRDIDYAVDISRELRREQV